jgi:hypothetical protein
MLMKTWGRDKDGDEDQRLKEEKKENRKKKGKRRDDDFESNQLMPSKASSERPKKTKKRAKAEVSPPCHSVAGTGQRPFGHSASAGFIQLPRLSAACGGSASAATTESDVNSRAKLLRLERETKKASPTFYLLF